MKYGTAVPLIGGLTTAAKQATGVDPAFFISYSAFADNEQHAKANFPNVPHYELDKEDNGFVLEQHKDVDFINAVCPCAGLSLLSSGSPEQRDGMNQWMLKTAEFVTGQVKPKVFWGENAPALYSNSGERVRNQLRAIADKNGYSFSIYGTNTEFHGIPQSRKRTFYFFWRDADVPVFEYFKRERKDLTNYLAEVPKDADRHTEADLEFARNKLMTSPYIMFLQDKHKGKGIDHMRNYLVEREKRGTTLLSYLITSEQIEEARDWMAARNHTNHVREADRVIAKIKEGKGFWDGSFPIYQGTGTFATLISRTLHALSLIHI